MFLIRFWTLIKKSGFAKLYLWINKLNVKYIAIMFYISVSSVQSLSRVQLFVTPWTAACHASLSITNSRSPSKPCPLSQWCHPIISSCTPLLLLPSIFPGIRVFSNESVLHIRWPKYWSFSFNISPSNEYSGLITFRTDRFDLLAVQGTHKSLLQHHSSKASILWCSALFKWSNSHIHTWLLENHSFDYMDLCWQSDISAF